MNEIVLDASVALRATYPDEPGHAEVFALLGDLLPSGFEPVAPDVFLYELGHSIRRGSGTPTQRSALYLEALQVVRLVRPSIAALMNAQAMPNRLSFYDAAYVATAEELGAPLWTEDAAILKAAPQIATDTAGLRPRLRL